MKNRQPSVNHPIANSSTCPPRASRTAIPVWPAAMSSRCRAEGHRRHRVAPGRQARRSVPARSVVRSSGAVGGS